MDSQYIKPASASIQLTALIVAAIGAASMGLSILCHYRGWINDQWMMPWGIGSFLLGAPAYFLILLRDQATSRNRTVMMIGGAFSFGTALILFGVSLVLAIIN